MPQYTTGELAKACGVSVRTVQFYDTRDLLKPSELTEGGRRLYSERDLQTLRLICLLKALGIALSAIKDILDSDDRYKVLPLLLEEQARQLGGEIEDREKQLQTIRILQESIRTTHTLPVHSISDIESIMNSQKKLRKLHATLLIVGILMDIVEIGTVLLWILKGIWWPFAVGMPIVILLATLLVRMYYRNTLYICANCNAHFRPKMKEFFFARHTSKTRKLTCSSCGHKGYCVETAAEKPEK